MAERTQITPQQVTNAAGDVENMASEYKGYYEEVLRAVDEFTSTDFVGDAADSFKEKVHDFTDDFQRMKELMDDYAAFLRKAANEWTDQITDYNAQIRQLQS